MKNLEESNQFGKELIPKPENPIVIDIPNDVIEAVAAVGDSVPRYAKIEEKGFDVNDKIIPQIIGRIVKMRPYGGKWVDNKLDEIPFVFGTDLPKGYAPRCDLDVEADGQVIKISLPMTTFVYHFSPYIQNLKNRGLHPGDVITRLRVKQVSGSKGPFPVAIFDAVDKVTEPTPVTPQPAINEPQVSESSQPQGSVNTQTADPSNPWA